MNLTKPRQTFIPIYNEEDANARYLLANTQTNFKDVNLMLVSNNGYEYTDEPGTRGRNMIWLLNTWLLMHMNDTNMMFVA